MVLRLFRQRRDITTEYSKEWLVSVGSFRQVVFDTIESVIIFAALQAAWDKTGHVAFFGFVASHPPIQSMIRRRANLMLREAFKENGISFATLSVQVEGDDRSNAAAAVTASKLSRQKLTESDR